MIEIERFQGVLFDLDGTLVDTMPIHYKAYQRVLRNRGVELAWPLFLQHIGPPAAVAIPLFAAAAGAQLSAEDVAIVHGEKKAIFERMLTETALTVLPASSLLGQLRQGQACGLVTSGNRQGVDLILHNLGWADFFQIIITGDDVERGKPDPEPYALAAESLGVKAADSVAFEDTEDGLASAIAAGMRAIDVRQTTWPSPIQ